SVWSLPPRRACRPPSPTSSTPRWPASPKRRFGRSSGPSRVGGPDGPGRTRDQSRIDRGTKGRTEMRRRMIPRVASVVFLIAFGLALAGRAEAATEIKWLQWWVNEWGPDNHASLITGFEKENPDIKVTVVDSPYPQMAG